MELSKAFDTINHKLLIVNLHAYQFSEDDLKFRDWDIEQKSEELYEVTNPIDQNEHYQVFLGNPVGCTCGKKNCEHIRTVLNS